MPLKPNDNPAKERSGDDDLDEAIGRVFARYGTDLSSFFRDAQQQARQDRCERVSKDIWTLVKKW